MEVDIGDAERGIWDNGITGSLLTLAAGWRKYNEPREDIEVAGVR